MGGVTWQRADWTLGKWWAGHSDVTHTADVPFVDSSLVTDRDSEKNNHTWSMWGGGAQGGATYADTPVTLWLQLMWS